MKHLLLLALASCLGLTSGQSISSCGKSSDTFANATFAVSPDPIEAGQALSITVSGSLTKILTAGRFDVNLSMKALGIFDVPIKSSAPFSTWPGLPAWDQTIVIGPFTLPKLPGAGEINGVVTASTTSGEAIFCLKIALQLASPPSEEEEDQATPPTPKAVSSAKQSLGPLSTKDDSQLADESARIGTSRIQLDDGVITAAGNINEDISSGMVLVDVNFKVLFLDFPIDLKVPFLFSPAVSKGPFKFSLGPSDSKPESRQKEMLDNEESDTEGDFSLGSLVNMTKFSARILLNRSHTSTAATAPPASKQKPSKKHIGVPPDSSKQTPTEKRPVSSTCMTKIVLGVPILEC